MSLKKRVLELDARRALTRASLRARCRWYILTRKRDAAIAKAVARGEQWVPEYFSKPN